MSQQAKKIYKTFHNFNCTRNYVTYLMECILCYNQYVGKAETNFNIRLNNHQKDAKKVDAIMACKHFKQESHFSINMQNLPLLISYRIPPNLKKLSPSDLSKDKFFGF